VLIHFDATGSVAALAMHLADLDSDDRIQGIIVLACVDNGFTPDVLDTVLAAVGKPIVGGVFPNLIHQAEKVAVGTIVWGVARSMSLAVIKHLSRDDVDLDEVLESRLGESEGAGSLQFVLVDGFASRIGAFLNALHDFTGPGCNTVGGGAGSLDMIQRPCIMTNAGLIQDAAVVARLGGSAGVGVAHGWSRIEGAFHVTDAEHTVVRSLDWRPAFDIYREVVEAHSGRAVTADNFFDVAKAYPFGLARLDAERIVRDPLMVGGAGSLVCVGEVSEGDHVDILHGDRDALMDAAEAARAQADASLGDKPGLRLFLDCISRVLFLEEDFEQELGRVAIDDVPVIGACTFGEIANSGGGFLEFYNKTSVVATLSEARARR